ncbi:hypothetical protein IGB42_01833 [Andreprevotia sp. IGB-42]|nr:hypothetical protein IGB42_01833 [Andreprevotia sp. IGB-42]
MKKTETHTQNGDARRARAELNALFGDSPNKDAPGQQEKSISDRVLQAQQQSEASALSNRIETLRRKREAMAAVQQMVANSGHTIADMQAMI